MLLHKKYFFYLIIFLFYFVIEAPVLEAQNVKNNVKDKTVTEEKSSTVSKPQNNESAIQENSGTQESDDEESVLKPLVIRGTRVRNRKKEEIQSISRQTMTAEDMKEVPASFGDSVSALTSLPGIMREGAGIFGSLVIRGADPSTNNYFVDDIPIYDPLHFGGLHSVINTNIIKDIDVYSSAFPAQFGSATSAVINISTIDRVNEYGGYFDVSLLSAAALLKAPIMKDKNNNLIFEQPLTGNDNEIINAGYVIASGRYGYVGLAIKAADMITGDDTPISPEYWDYQFKMKYRFNSVHSATIFLFGHKDFLRILMTDDLMEEGDDPLWSNMKMKYDTLSHNQGLYFDSEFGSKFSNRLMYFGSMRDIHYYYDLPAEGVASWAKNISVHSRPWIFGLKDKAKLKWLDDHAELRGSAEYTLYYFTASGNTIIPNGKSDIFDISDEDAFKAYTLDEKIINHVYSGFLENKFTFSGLTVTPGVRSDYLKRTNQATFDPRLMASYKFDTNTAVSAAGGHYSYFVQTNPFYFNANPDLAAIESDKIKPEKAWHSAIGIEQEIGLISARIEGFNNYFYDKPEAYPHTEPDGSYLAGLSSGKAKAYGFEIMLRKDSRDDTNGFFGWMSYTYTRAKYKSGLPTTNVYQGIDQGYVGDEFGNKWITSEYEQRHNFKFIAGYRLGKHILSGRFQYYSGLPYTPIVGNEPPVNERYVPITGDRNSKNYPSYYSLDLRYTHKTKYSWGYVSWYIEVINVLMKEQKNTEQWNWTETYTEGSNPKLSSEDGFTILPNIGVELKF